MKLTAELIESLSGVYLSPRYDSPQPTPDFHRECWKRYCSNAPACATAAPRGHAKSTALTHDYILANVLFRAETHVLILGASEDMAVGHLVDIRNELQENEDLLRDFKIERLLVDQKTDIIAKCTDGHQFRIVARGAEQKIRGMKWRGRRPGLIVFDDIEEDEQVESRERRKKFRRWFQRACMQALRTGGIVRGHGTILHEDSLLAHLMKDSTWESCCYKAHESFSDFSNILWPEQFPEVHLRFLRQGFINKRDAAGYSQEYLNDPHDYEDAYLRKEDFIPMTEADHEIEKVNCVGVDFAVSKLDSANRSSFTVGGKDTNNIIHIIDQRVARLDSLGIVEEFFSVQSRWSPDIFFVEDGQIWKAIAPMLTSEMQKRDIWLSIKPILPVKDKAVRGRSLQKRMRAGGCRFNTEASWYPEFEAELLRFTGTSEALLDDQFDSASLLSRGFEDFHQVETEDFLTEEEMQFAAQAAAFRKTAGRSAVTGY